MQRIAILLAALALLLVGVAEASAKPSREDRCAAFLLKATKNSIDCRIRLERRELLRNIAADFDICDTALGRATRRAERRFQDNCPSIEEVEVLAGLHAEATDTLVSAVTSPAFAPEKTYVVITFDDGLRASDMDTLQRLLGLSNPDGSKAQFTYYTRNYGTEYASVENWHAMGNEIANHTVSHGDADEGHKKSGSEWTQDGKASWIQELTDQDAIIELWGDVPKTDIVGFRCPNLACNSELFLEAFPIWSQDKLTASNQFVYDSSVPVVPGTTNGFSPPFRPGDCETTLKKYANTDWQAAIKFCQSPPEDCTIGEHCFGLYWGIEDVTIDGFWEMPLPSLLKVDQTAVPPYYNAMVPSNDGETAEQIMATFDFNYALAKKTGTPLMIAIHSAWLGLNGTANKDALDQWAHDLVTQGTTRYDENARLITTAQLVAMYAAESESVIAANPTKTARCDYHSGAAAGQATYCAGPAPSTSAGSPSAARCDSQCGSADYGGNPGGTAACNQTLPITTTTCSAVCGGSVDGADFSAGAGPWLGNPGGNCKTGPTCNYYPVAAVSGGGDSCPGN